MRVSSILSSSAVMAMASAADLALYWGQASGGAHQESLGDYCKNSPGEIYLISFLNSFGSGRALSMEVSGYWNNLPGTQLPDAASTIGEDIKTCQSLGKKVLVSMGGASGSYGFSSDSDAQQVAKDVWNVFGGGESATRPFGDAKVDGFDLDIESTVGAADYAAFVNELRQLYASDPSKQYYVSAAPQCPFPDAALGAAVSQAQFDFLFIQFYNNYCSTLGGNFNWNTWQTFASSQSPNKNVKLYLGLPGAQSAAGSGYATPEQVQQTVNQIKSTPNFGGIMLWDAAQANDNIVDGTSFAQAAQNILDGASPAAPSSSAAPAPAQSSTSPAAVAPQSTSSTTPAWVAPESTSSAGPAWVAPESTSSAGPAWVAPESTSSAAPVWVAPESSSAAAPVTIEQVVVTSHAANNGAPVTVTYEQTLTATSSCSTSTASPVNAAAAAETASPVSVTSIPTSTATKVITTPGANGEDVYVTVRETFYTTEPCSTTAIPVSVTSIPTSTATKVITTPGSNGEDVYVTVHETFYTTESCPPTAGSDAQATTVHSTSYVQQTLPGVTTTQTSWPRTTSAEHHYHDFTSDGEVYVFETKWNTDYTTVWVR